MKTITTKHPEIGYTNNVEIIERALRLGFGLDDNSSVMLAVAQHVWAYLTDNRPRYARGEDGYEWDLALVRTALDAVESRVHRMKGLLSRNEWPNGWNAKDAALIASLEA